MAEPERIEAAVEYAQALARAGFGIVEAYAPTDAGGCTCRAAAECHSPGKHPVGDDWQKGATRSPATIAQIVRRRAGQYGVIPWPGERGLILDVDHADRLPVKLPPSLRVSSRPGRGHAYFRLPAGYAARSLPATAAWGEIRVEGASRHVIGPWSRHAAGTVYTPTGSPADIAELPADVLAHLFPPAQPTLMIAGPGYQLPDPGYTGSRYEAIRDYVASRYHHRLTEAELWAGVREVLAPRFAEPLPEAGPDSLRERFDRAWHGTPAKLGPPAADGPANHSSGPDAQSERKQLTFLTARTFAAATPEDVDWIAPRYIARGATVLLVGGPKGGKSTLYAHLIGAALDGSDFLGERVTRTPVVLLTEQGPSSLRPLLARVGLLDRDDLHLLLWRDTRGASWPSVVEEAVAQCRAVGAGLLIVDTLAQFAGLAGDSENDAGAALDAMRPLQAAAADGLAVLIVHHERKGAGAIADSGRGSSAFAGAVDVILALRRGDGESRPTIRHLHALSRFDDTPEELVIELTEAGYVALGSAVNFAVEEAKEATLAAIGEEPLTTAQLVEATGLKRTAVYAALTELADAGKVTREGKGTRGDPHRYFTLASFGPEPIRQSLIGPDERNGGAGADLVDEARKVFADDLVPWDMSAMVPRPRADA
jgi:DNA-binding transcriptional ArsR family regulator